MASISPQLCATSRFIRLFRSARPSILHGYIPSLTRHHDLTCRYHRFTNRSWSIITHTRSFHDAVESQPHQENKDEDNTHSQSDDNSNMGNQLQNAAEYKPASVVADLSQAVQWNQGSSTWDPQFCSMALDKYERHLRYILYRLEQHRASTHTALDKNPQEDSFITIAQQIHPDTLTYMASKELLSPSTAEKAFKTVLKMKIHTSLLSKRVRELERLIGSIRLTPITDALSFRLLEANAKAGNVGRTLALLHLRKAKGYPPSNYEFEHAIRSIHSAGLYLRCNRNVFISDKDQPEIDNPTRWLDAILMNMSARNFALSTDLANRMLDCYAQTGRSGKAVHYFYKVSNLGDSGTHPTITSSKESLDSENTMDTHPRNPNTNTNTNGGSMTDRRKAKVRIKFNKSPPYYKVMSEVQKRGGKVHLKNHSTGDTISKAELEKDRHWSLPLTAAFAFADSLTFGACGHQPIQLDLTSWNTLIKVCCYRGSLWRAVEILNETMPRHGISPDTYTYNTILSGFARVGDTTYMRELLTTMTNKEIPLDKYTIQALVDGYLNTGDISGAITIVQDVFNQHQVLPPYTSHLKIIEFSLGYDLVFEAKRHVYFVQQLWKWKPSNHDTDEFRKMMNLTIRNPKLSKAAIQRLFQYFGENLDIPDY